MRASAGGDKTPTQALVPRETGEVWNRNRTLRVPSPPDPSHGVERLRRARLAPSARSSRGVEGATFDQASRGTPAQQARGLEERYCLGEVLAEHCFLALVVRADVGAVEPLWGFEHPLERELAEGLPVLNHERHVTRPDL
jgi:hypothetical protein